MTRCASPLCLTSVHDGRRTCRFHTPDVTPCACGGSLARDVASLRVHQRTMRHGIWRIRNGL